MKDSYIVSCDSIFVVFVFSTHSSREDCDVCYFDATKPFCFYTNTLDYRHSPFKLILRLCFLLSEKMSSVLALSLDFTLKNL